MKRKLSKMMPYKELIKEHENIVKVLKSGSKTKIKKLLEEQSYELHEYKEEYKRKLSRL